jgi:integrase
LRDRLAAVWGLALASGLRRAELCGLQWPDFEGDSVLVQRQALLRPRAVQGERRLYLRETSKGRRSRRVRIDEQRAQALRRWRAAQAAEQLAFGRPWKTTD